MRAEAKVLNTDFIYTAVRSILSPEQQLFSHAIINPPYKKINAGSRHRYLLRKVGIRVRQSLYGVRGPFRGPSY